jgi:hypothetical protein
MKKLIFDGIEYFPKDSNKYEITKEQIETIYADGCTCVKEWFPEAFNKLATDFTGWVKSTSIGNEKWLMFSEKGLLRYGFDSNGEWFLPDGIANVLKKDVEATESEVFEAFKNEAFKRGYKEGVFLHRPFWDDLNDCVIDKENFPNDMDFYYDKNKDYLEFYGFVVYSKGQWAEIIPTITKEEAEKLLNKKII